MKKKELEPVSEKTVEAITYTLVLGGVGVALYYISVWAGWIEPLF